MEDKSDLAREFEKALEESPKRFGVADLMRLEARNRKHTRRQDHVSGSQYEETVITTNTLDE